MKYCLNTKKNVLMRKLCLFLFLAIGIAFIINALLLTFIDYNVSKLRYLLFALPGFGISVFAVYFYGIEARKYAVNTHGITIKYFNGRTITHPWSTISEIAICDINNRTDINDTSSLINFDMVIRMVVGSETKKEHDYTLRGVDRWRSSEYNTLLYQRIIIIDYTKDRLDEITEASRRTVIDLRSRQGKTQHIEL